MTMRRPLAAAAVLTFATACSVGSAQPRDPQPAHPAPAAAAASGSAAAQDARDGCATLRRIGAYSLHDQVAVERFSAALMLYQAAARQDPRYTATATALDHANRVMLTTFDDSEVRRTVASVAADCT